MARAVRRLRNQHGQRVKPRALIFPWSCSVSQTFCAASSGASSPMDVILPRLRTIAVMGISCSSAAQTSALLRADDGRCSQAKPWRSTIVAISVGSGSGKHSRARMKASTSATPLSDACSLATSRSTSIASVTAGHPLVTYLKMTLYASPGGLTCARRRTSRWVQPWRFLYLVTANASFIASFLVYQLAMALRCRRPPSRSRPSTSRR